MPQLESREKLLPQFAKVGALEDMAQVAKRLVVAKKAIEQIRAIEDKLEREKGSTLERDFALAMAETARYAGIAAENAKQAAAILKKLKPRVEAYQRKLKDAAS